MGSYLGDQSAKNIDKIFTREDLISSLRGAITTTRDGSINHQELTVTYLNDPRSSRVIRAQGIGSTHQVDRHGNVTDGSILQEYAGIANQARLQMSKTVTDTVNV